MRKTTIILFCFLALMLLAMSFLNSSPKVLASPNNPTPTWTPPSGCDPHPCTPEPTWTPNCPPSDPNCYATPDPTQVAQTATAIAPYMTPQAYLPAMLNNYTAPTVPPTPTKRAAGTVIVNWPQPAGTAADFGGCASWNKSGYTGSGTRTYSVEVGKVGGPLTRILDNSTDSRVEYWPDDRDGLFQFFINEYVNGEYVAWNSIQFEFLNNKWDCSQELPWTPAPPRPGPEETETPEPTIAPTMTPTPQG